MVRLQILLAFYTPWSLVRNAARSALAKLVAGNITEHSLSPSGGWDLLHSPSS